MRSAASTNPMVAPTSAAGACADGNVTGRAPPISRSRCGSPARADRRVRGTADPGARRPGRRPLHPRHAQAHQPRGAGAHPAPRRRGAGAGRRRQRGRQHPRPRRPAAPGRLRRRRRAGPRAARRRSPRRGIPIDGILVRRGYRTACKTRVLAGARHAIKQQIVRFDVEDPSPLTDAERADLERRLVERSSRCRVFVLSDYGLGAADPALAVALAARDGLVRIADSRYRLGDLAASTAPRPTKRSSRRSKAKRASIARTRRAPARRLERPLPPAHAWRPRHDPVRGRTGGDHPGPRHRSGRRRHRRRRHRARHLRARGRRRCRPARGRACSPTTRAASW